MTHIGRTLAPLLAAGLLAALGCREDAESPTAPESAPALATTATQALAFYQVSAGNRHSCGITTDNRAYCWGAALWPARQRHDNRPVAAGGGSRPVMSIPTSIPGPPRVEIGGTKLETA